MSASNRPPLSELLKPLPVGDLARVDALFEHLEERATQAALSHDAICCLKSIMENAPFLRDLMLGSPDFLFETLARNHEDTVQHLLLEVSSLSDIVEDEKHLMTALRGFKKKMALTLALADLGKVETVGWVTKALTNFADATLLSSVRFCLGVEAKRGKLVFSNENEPEKDSGLILLAMGKHGAGELNYSSDIDLIAFFDATRLRDADPYEVQPAMVRIIKRLVKIMQERNEDGYVFRVDLRLRPDPGATAVALSTEAALTYYESLGQNWERAAFIKARPVACDMAAAQEFLEELSPFVWRKYMDFAMIADVQSMKRLTHQHKGHGEIAIQGHDVKLGRGGIREIEFFVQTQQLIAGGRNPDLRDRDTLSMLAKLSDTGWIDHKVAAELSVHYCFLRDVEHRIQMRQDEQTHLLPKDEEGFSAISRLTGFSEETDFINALNACFTTVSLHYSGLFQEGNAEENYLVFAEEDDHPETLAALEDMGFERVTQVNSIVRSWFQGHYRALRTKRAQSTLNQMVPKLLKAFSNTAQPNAALFAFDMFLKRLPAGIQLFSLLKANEHLLDLIAQVMGSAPRLSETIARHPHVFDAVLEPAFFDTMPTKTQIEDQLAVFLGEATDYQDVLDRARIFTQEQKFLIGTRLLSNTLTRAESQALYADLADCVLEALLNHVMDEMARTHGRVPGGDVAIVAMGKLGGREMSPTSDLDLILIYEVEEEVQQSDGRRPLAVMQYFARLTQRFIAALSAPSGEGIAYPVDMRLRPSGKSGPLATDLEAFKKYQKESAWTWEHLALTRARLVGGKKALRERIEETIGEVLARKRDLETLKQDVVDMNERLHEAKTTDSFWDVKAARGGLIDVEFLTQYFQLSNAWSHPSIMKQNTASALSAIYEAKILEIETFKTLSRAHQLFSDIIQMVRLCSDENVDGENVSAELASRLCLLTDLPDIRHLEAEIQSLQSAVIAIFERCLKTDR